MKQTKRVERGVWMKMPLAAGALTMVLAGCGGNSGGGGTLGSGSGPSVATVEGKAITRGELQAYAEAKVGEPALAELIDYSLIMSDLKAKGLEVSDKEVSDDLAERVRTADPTTQSQIQRMMKSDTAKSALEHQARLRLAVEKIATKDIKVTDSELKAWFEKNKDKYYPARVKLAMLVSAQKTRADAMARQLTGKTKTFKQLVDEQKKVADPIGQSSTMETPVIPMDQLSGVLKTAVDKLKPGQVSSVIEMKPGAKVPPAYLITRLEERQGKEFESARASIEQDYKIEQLARREQKKTDPKTSFEQAMQKVQQEAGMQAMMSRQPFSPMAPREIWGMMVRPAEQGIITELRQKGKVEINDTFYEGLKSNYGTPPVSIMPGGPAGASSGATAPPTGNTATP